MPVDRLNIRQFLPDRRAVRCAICVGLFILWFPVFGLAQTLTVEMARGPLEDGRLREAIMLSTDWMRAGERTGLDIRGVTLRHANQPETTRKTQQNLKKAKSLLSERGGASGRIQLIVFFDPQRTARLAQLVAANLRTLGLQPRLVPLPEGARAKMQQVMRSRADISDAEPGFIVLTWNSAEILKPNPRGPEIDLPERLKPDDAAPERFPDLVVSQFHVDYDPGARVLTVTALVENIGRGAVSARFAVSFPDSTGVIADQLGRHIAGPLAPGAQQWVETRFRVDDSILEGRTVRLRAVADAGSTIRESNERNNYSIERSVFLERLAPPMPDFVIVALDPAYDRLTRRLSVQVFVRNVGKSPSRPSKVRIAETQKHFGFPEIAMPAIAPGGSAVGVAEVIVPETALGEVAMLVAMANADRKLRETSFDNNSFGPVRVALNAPPAPQRPDLLLSGLFAEHDAVQGHVKLRVEVMNGGPVPSVATRVRFTELRNQMPDVDMTLQALAPGQRAIVSAETPLAPSPEAREMTFVARGDVDGYVDESREDNNESRVGPLRIPATSSLLPDLEVTALAAGQARMGAPLAVTAQIVNAGDFGSAATEVVLTVAGTDPVVAPLPTLRPGEMYKLRLELPVQAALFGNTVEVSLEADPERRIGEYTVQNNLRRMNVALRVPILPWAGLAGAGLVALLVIGRVILRGGPPEPQAKILAHLVRLQPSAHAGHQRADPEPGSSGVEFEVSLRPIRGSRSVTVTRLADTGEPET
ncbi:CARDB domain-containing protein [Roseovarius sp. M141]|uniref:CARDB domain-containing protein n=1 Tax=Roseovarius sp. M141 TaxID=2583806 RepID=UPI0020CDBAA9|nr:CARDB domain-containing protein [Roseovarius sp. M141]